MLEQMLDAELEALAGSGSSPVAMHVRECSRCRVVAEQLVADTKVLALAVETLGPEVAGGPEVAREPALGTRRRMPRARYLIVGSLAAAALALVVVRPGADDGVRPTGSVRPTATAPRSASPPVDESSSPSLVGRAPRPFPRARPVSATRFVLPAGEHEVAMAQSRAVVSVTPPPGKRVAVMRTRDPGVTVVWLY
jgi:hypothetical protein